MVLSMAGRGRGGGRSSWQAATVVWFWSLGLFAWSGRATVPLWLFALICSHRCLVWFVWVWEIAFIEDTLGGRDGKGSLSDIRLWQSD